MYEENRIGIQMSFKTTDFMKPSFIIDMLELVDFNEKYKVQKCWGNIKGKYSKKELLNIFEDIPFYSPCLRFIFEYNDLELEIYNSWISGFTCIEIRWIKEIKNVLEIFQKLCQYFQDNFFTILCSDINFRYIQRTYSPYDNGLVHFFGISFLEYNPGYIYDHYGIYFGSSWKMYYGKYFYDFISKEKLLSFKEAYQNYEENNIVKTTLFENPFEASTTENMLIQKQYKKYMKFRKLEKYIESIYYCNEENNSDYLKGYEDERCYYIEDKPKDKYMIDLLSGKTLTLKKYKKSVFYFMDDDLGVGECYAIFLYTKDGKFPKDTSIEEPPARLTVMAKWTNKSIKEDALEHGYKYKRISSSHYVMEKEDAKSLIIRHLYTTKEEEEYEIDLEITKSKLTTEELEKVMDEYNKMIKTKRVRGVE